MKRNLESSTTRYQVVRLHEHQVYRYSYVGFCQETKHYCTS